MAVEVPTADDLPMLPAGAIPAQPSIAGQQLQHATDQPPPAGDDSLPIAPPSILGTSYTTVGGTGKGSAVPDTSGGSRLVARSLARAPARAALADIVTGNDFVRHPELGPVDMPGLGLGVTDPKAWGIVGNMALSRDPVALGHAIKSRLPDASVAYDDTDAQGNPIPASPNAPGSALTVQVPGGPKMYLNRPGFNAQKGLFYGPQTAVALATSGRSLPLQMAAGGTQHAASQLGSDALGGEEKPFDMIGTAISTLAPAVLASVGYAGLKGVDWLSRKTIGTAEDIANRARTLHTWGFNPTEGTVTADPTKLAYEDFLANSGQSSDAARGHLKGLNDSNAEQNLVNKRTIIGNITGEVPPGAPAPDTFQPNVGQYGDKVNASITGRVNALTGAEKAAWAKLGDVSPDTAAGRGVVFSPDVSTDVLAKSADVMRRFYGAPQGPNGNYSAAQLGDTGQLAVDAFQQLRRVMLPTGPGGQPGTLQGFNLGHLQDMRQTLGNVISDKPGTPAAAAATQMKRALDDAIAAAETTPGRIAGNPQLITDFRDANAATRAKYNFTEPRDNPAAERLIAGVTNPDAPHTGQQTVNSIFGGGGVVTPDGGTNAALSHLKFHLGDEATKPLGGALGVRTLYGRDGTAALAEDAPARFDYNSTAGRIGEQVKGTGADVSRTLLPAEMQQQLQHYREALFALGAGNRAGGPRLNPSGTSYALGTAAKNVPVLGSIYRDLKPTFAAENATQRGSEIVKRAVGGANTTGDLGVSLPRGPSSLNDPNFPYLSWLPEAQRAGGPAYTGGGLLGSQLFPRAPAQNSQQP